MNQDLFRRRFRRKLCSLNISDYHGLKGPGLTCYLNCILQVLFMTEDFREAVKRSSKGSTSFDSHLADLFATLQTEMAKTHIIIRKLGITNVFEQRDAAEYFEKILCRTSQEASKMFKGELNHRTKCLKCKQTNDSRSFFWVLPLVVEDSRHQISSVKEGLATFFKGEKFCGENKIFCSQCQKKQDQEFECTITQSPEILTLLLKRFSYNDVCRCYIKLHCKVEIPKTLHLASCTYDLYAVVDHCGELTGGHYTAQIKSFETQSWYSFNDESVQIKHNVLKTDDKCLKSRTAYLLMYRKVRKHPEKRDDGDTSCTNFEAKEKLDETQREEEPAPHEHVPKMNFKHSNGEISTELQSDMVFKKWTNFLQSLEDPSHQTAPLKSVIQRDEAQADPDPDPSTSHVKNCLSENKHEVKLKCELGRRKDSEKQKFTAAKTETREADVGFTGNRVQPEESKVQKNKTEEDVSKKIVTKGEKRLAKKPWR